MQVYNCVVCQFRVSSVVYKFWHGENLPFQCSVGKIMVFINVLFIHLPPSSASSCESSLDAFDSANTHTHTHAVYEQR